MVGDGGYGERRRRWCSAGRERERGRGGESRGRVRESRGEAWRRPGHRGEEGRAGRQGERWRGAVARARAGHTPLPLSGRRRQRREVGWAGCWLGQPAGWAAQWRSPGKLLPLLFFFCFLISDICSDLNNILNHLFNLCQFLQELYILFQSSFINGIIFGHILIYINNIFPMQIIMH